MKIRTGTKEWADKSYNIGYGCSHNCRYCYAREFHVRFHRVKSNAAWPLETIRSELQPIPRNSTVMFPTTHDISPGYLEASLETIDRLLHRNNRVLIVSKPHLQCIQQICDEFQAYQHRLLFRLSIGSAEQKHADFWEPGAPPIKERVACLRLAQAKGFRTSVSMEPFLSDVEDAVEIFHRVRPHVTGFVWVGRMKNVKRRVPQENAEVVRRCDQLLKQQSDAEILRLVGILGNEAKVRWKDSVKKVLLAHPNSKNRIVQLARRRLIASPASPDQEWNSKSKATKDKFTQGLILPAATSSSLT